MASNIPLLASGLLTPFCKTISAPAMGTEYGENFAGLNSKGIIIEGFAFSISTSVAVANRFPCVIISGTNPEFLQAFPALTAAAAAQVVNYHVNTTGQAKANFTDSLGDIHSWILFGSVFVPPGFSLETRTTDIDGDDEYSAMRIWGYVL